MVVLGLYLEAKTGLDCVCMNVECITFIDRIASGYSHHPFPPSSLVNQVITAAAHSASRMKQKAHTNSPPFLLSQNSRFSNP